MLNRRRFVVNLIVPVGYFLSFATCFAEDRNDRTQISAADQELLDLLEKDPATLKKKISSYKAKELFNLVKERLKKIGKRGHGREEIQMLHLHWYQIGTENNRQLADSLIKRAAEKGHPEGLYNYAIRFNQKS